MRGNAMESNEVLSKVIHKSNSTAIFILYNKRQHDMR